MDGQQQQPMTMPQMYAPPGAPAISINPADATPGGFLDDVDVIIASASACLWNYDKPQYQWNPFLKIEFVHEDGTQAGKPQYYSAGDAKHFLPSQDGKTFCQVGQKTTLNENCNAVFFLQNLVNGGFPADKLGSDLSVIVGTHVHMNAVPRPKREGLEGQKENQTIPVPTKVNALPSPAAGAVVSQKAAPQAQAKAQAKAQAQAQAQAQAANQAQVPAGNGSAASADLESKATETVLNVLTSKGGTITKAQLAQEAFKVLSKDPDRNTLVQMVFSDPFLSKAGQPWAFNGTQISM